MDREQIDILHGFFAHVASVNFDGAKPDFGFYASRMDEAGIPWHVQNKIACAAESRENVYGLYFTTILKNLNLL